MNLAAPCGWPTPQACGSPGKGGRGPRPGIPGLPQASRAGPAGSPRQAPGRQRCQSEPLEQGLGGRVVASRPSPLILPSPATHSRVSAGMCSLSLRDFMARPGRVYTVGCQRPLRGPQNPAGGVIARGPPDADAGTAHPADAARAGPRGAGAGSPRLGAGLRAPHLRAGPAQRPQRLGCGPGRRVALPRGKGPRDRRVRGPRTARRDRGGCRCIPDRIADPPPGPAPPAPALPQLWGSPGPTIQAAPTSNPGTGAPWRRVPASVRTLRPRPRLQARAPRVPRPRNPVPTPHSDPTLAPPALPRRSRPTRPRRRGRLWLWPP